MECVQNLLLGDPVYDERGQLVRREYGLKNALALFVLGYIAYTLYCSMGKKVFSGTRKGRKGKMKGGSSGSRSDSGSDGKSGIGSKIKSVINVLFWLSFIYALGMIIWMFVDHEGAEKSGLLPWGAMWLILLPFWIFSHL